MAFVSLKQIGLLLLAEVLDLELGILFLIDEIIDVVFNHFLLHFDYLHVALLLV